MSRFNLTTTCHHMRQLRPNCECCHVDLPPASPLAMICSFECTLCADGVAQRLHGRCPHGGRCLVRRPVRCAGMRARHPASQVRVSRPRVCQPMVSEATP